MYNFFVKIKEFQFQIRNFNLELSMIIALILLFIYLVIVQYSYGYESINLFPPLELSALNDLYNSTDGEHWLWDGYGKEWNFTEISPNPCLEQWEGLICSSNCTVVGVECHVVGILIQAYNLIGTIPPSIGNFSELEDLSLSENYLYGSIPDSIGNLLKLKYFYPCFNQLSGSLPLSVFSLPSLTIYLGFDNYITGTISPSIVNASSLIFFDADYNFLNGTIPYTLCNMSNLVTFSVSTNHLTSTLPSCLGEEAIELVVFYAQQNFLTGSLPPSLTSITSLQTLSLFGNAFSGTISSNFSKLIFMTNFDIQNNYFTGFFPARAMENMTILETFNINNNLFTGPLPTVLSFSLYQVQLHENQFTGNIPKGYGTQAPILAELSLSMNKLTGTIPGELANAETMLFFDVSDNLLTGTIPSSFQPSSTSPGWRSINFLLVANNFLTGNMNAIFGLSNLTNVNVSTNLLTGSFCGNDYTFRNVSSLDISSNILTGGCLSHLLMNSHALLTLSVANNQFSGRLDHLTPSRRLATLDLSNNQFTGSIPSEIFENNEHLISISLLKNCLTGSLPVESICRVSSLQSLALDGLHTADYCQDRFFTSSVVAMSTAYRLTESIPGGLPSLQCLFNMTSLQTLHLSGNGITGSIPSDLEVGESLQDLSLSYNLLTGSIPLVIQEKTNWLNLDLSFNKLSGILHDSFATPSEKTSIKMMVNRLSGIIPSSIREASTIEILQGNIFDCHNIVVGDGQASARKRQLPVNDQYAANYNCGSESVNVALYVWMSVVVGVPLMGLMMVGCGKWCGWEERHRLLSMWKEYLSRMQSMIVGLFKSTTTTGKSGLDEEHLSIIHNMIMSITVFAMVILMPLYCILSMYYSTHSSVYIWVFSIAYVSGVAPAIALMMAYFVFYVIFAAEWKTVLFASSKSESRWRSTRSTYWSSLEFMKTFLRQRQVSVYRLWTTVGDECTVCIYCDTESIKCEFVLCDDSIFRVQDFLG